MSRHQNHSLAEQPRLAHLVLKVVHSVRKSNYQSTGRMRLTQTHRLQMRLRATVHICVLET